jgi:DNA-binding NarL/FixJ family response regulator
MGLYLNKQARSVKLLIADDSDVLRNSLSQMISEIKGIEIVGEAADARIALERVERLKPDVVILDIRMPGMDGIAALESLKKKANPPIVIIFTNYPYLQYRKRCLDAGADYFFYKATEFGMLIDLLKKLARNL